MIVRVGTATLMTTGVYPVWGLLVTLVVFWYLPVMALLGLDVPLLFLAVVVVLAFGATSMALASFVFVVKHIAVRSPLFGKPVVRFDQIVRDDEAFRLKVTLGDDGVPMVVLACPNHWLLSDEQRLERVERLRLELLS